MQQVSGDTLITRSRSGFELLYVRAVLREADLRDSHRASLPDLLPLTEPRLSELTFSGAAYPCLELARESGVRIRFEGKPYAPLREELADMQAKHGALVLVTMLHPELDECSTITSDGRRALVCGSKTAWYKWLRVHARHCARFVCQPQRDEYGRTHSHALVPLMMLSKSYQSLIAAAPTGRGGGLLLPRNIHAVRLGVTANDHEGVARYLSRFMDDRSMLPRHTQEWLELAEEVAENMHYSDGERVNVCWRLPPRWKTEKLGT